MRPEKKSRLLQRRRWRIRKKVAGTRERPRMSVRFTGKNIHVQFIDDDAGVTLAAASSVSKAVRNGEKVKANVAGAQRLGKLAAEAALNQGIQTVVFDRSGARFHGKVKALAEAAREAGLKL